jgi:hypothetical protein
MFRNPKYFFWVLVHLGRCGLLNDLPMVRPRLAHSLHHDNHHHPTPWVVQG